MELVYADRDGDPLDRPGPKCPYGQPGDRLWGKETYQVVHVSIDPETGHGEDIETAPKIPRDDCDGYWTVRYAATDPEAGGSKEDRGFAWCSSIFMPRWASRLPLDVVSVRAERLQDIDAAGAIAECVDVFLDRRTGLHEVPWFKHQPIVSQRLVYGLLWDHVYGAGAGVVEVGSSAIHPLLLGYGPKY